MATPQETHDKNAYMNIPIEEEEEEAAFHGYGCGCFRQLFCLGRRQRCNVIGNGGKDNEHRRLLQGRGDGDKGYVRGREGWKDWMRKMGAYLNMCKRRMGWGRGRGENNFQYDWHDYALNFDEGEAADDDQEKLSFSARFAPPFRDQIQIQRPVVAAA